MTQCSGRKHQKVSDMEQNMPTIDRLSGLPDDILCHILSFLPTKRSVATSILARRWRFLWAYVPLIEFKDYDGMYKSDRNYSDIINRVMFLYKAQSISTFRLFFNVDDCGEYQPETWIATAIARNVQNLDFYLLKRVMLPRCLFTSKTPVYLRLHHCGGIPMTGVICLPHLKTLQLTSFQYESLPRLLSGCPVLEVLIIRRILAQDLVFYNISSPTIKRLEVEFWSDDSGAFHDDYRLEINTPALRYLKVSDLLSKHIKAGVLTSLMEAEITLWKDADRDFTYTVSVLEFVDRLCYIECLKFDINGCYTTFLKSAISASTIRFHNLTKLELSAYWGFLLKFLKCADNLEILIFREVFGSNDGWMEVEPEQVPTCLLSHLRTATIATGLHGLEVVRYLLSNAHVLERMEVCTDRNYYDDEVEYYMEREFFSRKIPQFQRASEACELVFDC